MFPIQNVLVSCGLLVAPLCIATDILAATLFYPGYDYTSQQVSELSAIGAPSRSFWLLMSGVLALTTAGFGIGVWRATGARLLIRIAGIAIVVFTIHGLLWVLFAPMHMRATAFTATDTAHIAFTIAAVLMMLCFISCGGDRAGVGFPVVFGPNPPRDALSRWHRWYANLGDCCRRADTLHGTCRAHRRLRANDLDVGLFHPAATPHRATA